MGGTTEKLELGQLREKLRKMTDRQLRGYGNEFRKFCKSERKQGREPEVAFVIRLEEATAEWRRRKTPRTGKYAR
jgi:hypothetical protein